MATYAKEAERAAAGLLGQLESELDDTLKDFIRAFTQSSEVRGFWNEYTALRQATDNFEKLAFVFQQRTDDLKRHEQFIAESLSKDA